MNKKQIKNTPKDYSQKRSVDRPFYKKRTENCKKPTFLHKHKDMKIKIISLFSGMGCSFEAFKEEYKTKGISSDVEYTINDKGKRQLAGKYAMQIERYHYPHIKQVGDVKGVDMELIQKEKCKGADLVVGGPPCQSFSVAGKQKGFKDPRGKLFLEIIRVIKETKPKVFIIENVKGILSKKHKGKKITDMFAEDLWGIQPKIIKGSIFTAQNRDRVFWAGELKEDGTYKQIDIRLREDSGIILEDVLETTNCVEEKYYTKGKWQGNKTDKYKNFNVPRVNGNKNTQCYRYQNAEEHKKSLTIAGGLNKIEEKFYLSQKNADSYDKVSSIEQKDLCAKNKKSHTLITSYDSAQLKDTVERKRKTLVIEKHYISKERIKELKDKNIYVSEQKEDEFGVYVTMIRKLTPLECDRLMGLNDNHSEKGINEKGEVVQISDSQRYKSDANAFIYGKIQDIYESSNHAKDQRKKMGMKQYTWKNNR